MTKNDAIDTGHDEEIKRGEANIGNTAHFDEEGFYTDVIVPKMEELVRLLEEHKMPYLIHIVYSNDEEKTGAGTLLNAYDRMNGDSGFQIKKMLLCGGMLSGEIDAIPVPISSKGLKDGHSPTSALLAALAMAAAASK